VAVLWVVVAVLSGRSLPTFQRSLLPPSLIALMMEAARTSKTLVNFYQATRRYNPEDIHLRNIKAFAWKFMINISQESRYAGRDSKQELPEKKGRVLLLH
jgi:hypothetical protein